MRAAVLACALLLGLLTACSRLPLIGSSAGDAGVDYGQPGPYAVGATVRPFTWTLPSGETRTFDVYFRYPVSRPSEPGAVASSAAAGPPEPARDGRPFPLIVFSHGSNVTPVMYTNITSHLASHGFVVAAPLHLNCRAPCSSQVWEAIRRTRPQDAVAILDNLLTLNASDDPIFMNLVDPERVGVGGHSFGGWTTLSVLERDPRFRAGIATSPATFIQPYPDPAKVSQPLLLVAGTLDSWVPYAATADFFRAIPPSAPDHYLLAVQQAGHQFDDGCHESLVTTTCAASMPQPQLLALEGRVATAFFLRYVAGRPVTDAQLGLDDQSAEFAVVKGPPDGPAVAPTARPLQSTAASERPAGTVLLADDLTGAQGGALPASSADPTRYRAGYVDGAYEIALEQGASRNFVRGETVLPGSYADASIAVNMAMVDPTPNHYAQLICRSQGPDSQYRFGVRPATGEVWISRGFSKPEFSIQPESIALAYLVPLGLRSSAVHPGNATNRLELSCRGTTITARVNGVTVASVTDNTYGGGQMWLAAGENAGGPNPGARATARFSNLVVTQE